MTITPEALASIQAINPSAQVMAEGGQSYVYLPNQVVRVGEAKRNVDALLCPTDHSGYVTRLFLAEPLSEVVTIKDQPANWTVHSILGRTWHSWSWQGVSQSLSLPQMLLAHLHAFR